MDTGRGTSHPYQGVGSGGVIALGEIPNVDDGLMGTARLMGAANHIAMYVPMQQFCMIYTCTLESKVQ